MNYNRRQLIWGEQHAEDSACEGRSSSALKLYRAGTHRSKSPTETLDFLLPHLPALGITRVANVTGLDNIGIPVVMAVRPESRSISVAQGKGLTLDAAKVSALMESIETYHAERISLPLRLASYHELFLEKAVVNIENLCRVNGVEFQSYDPMLWIEGYSLVNESKKMIPFEVVHTAYTQNMQNNLGVFFNSTAGLAAGNHPLEAISHGMLELIERDACLLSSLEDDLFISDRKIDISSIHDVDCLNLIRKLHAAGVGLAAWETTRDIQAPSFRCVIADMDDRNERRICAAAGLGCHTSRGVALFRAIIEAVQTRLTIISGARDDLLKEKYVQNFNSDVINTHRMLIKTNGVRSFLLSPSNTFDDFGSEIDFLLSELERNGLDEVLVVDLTRENLKIPVFRVIIPGLEIYDDVDDCMPGYRARKVLSTS